MAISIYRNVELVVRLSHDEHEAVVEYCGGELVDIAAHR
jgi:hypothetical protein